ncbi:MAG: PEP-CTERM sorting domain-containing protein [Akkermansia muciniphila]|nr:PEP-CTERM sorting domain-containing protein [Akkermansia muciniphila]
MKLRSLLRSRILPLAALLALAAPPSRAAVEIITFGPAEKSLFSTFATDHVTTLSNGTSVTLSSKDSLQCITTSSEESDSNIDDWKNTSALASLNNDLGTHITVRDIVGTTTMLRAAHNTGDGLCLNLASTHPEGESITLYMFVTAKAPSSTSTLWNLDSFTGFLSLLDNATLMRAVSNVESGFVSCDATTKIGVTEPKHAILKLSGNIKQGGTELHIPLSIGTSVNNEVYSIGAVLYAYDVPEPTSTALVLSGLLLLCRRRRRG